MAKPTMGACVITERFYLVGGIEFENRSNSGVWNICSYESLRPVDSSSQSGNFLSRLNTTHSLNSYQCREVCGLLERASGCGKGWRTIVGKFVPHLADSCWIMIVCLKVLRLQPQRFDSTGKSAHAAFHQIAIAECLTLFRAASACLRESLVGALSSWQTHYQLTTVRTPNCVIDARNDGLLLSGLASVHHLTSDLFSWDTNSHFECVGVDIRDRMSAVLCCAWEVFAGCLVLESIIHLVHTKMRDLNRAVHRGLTVTGPSPPTPLVSRPQEKRRLANARVKQSE